LRAPDSFFKKEKKTILLASTLDVQGDGALFSTGQGRIPPTLPFRPAVALGGEEF
jgi:hypothetical protein